MIKKLRTYYISYGLAGGDWSAIKLRHALEEAGLKPAKPDDADIIIAHSAGCWLIPENIRPLLVVYIGMPLAQEEPFKTWRAVTKTSATKDMRHYFLTGFKSVYYLLTQPRRNIDIIRRASTARPVIFSCRTVFIASRYDCWTKGPMLKRYIKTMPWAFISLSGFHDLIWDRPEDYVEIIKHFIE